MSLEPTGIGTGLRPKEPRQNPWWAFPALLIFNGIIAGIVYLALKGAS